MRIVGGAHVVIMIWPFRGQFNDVAIGIPEIDRVDESVIGNPPGLDPVCDAFVHHLLQPVVFDLQRNVQIKVALVFKLERCLRIVKKGKKRPVSHLVERVQHLGAAAGYGGADLQRMNQG